MDKMPVSVNILKSELSKIKDNSLVIGFFKDGLNLDGELKKFDNELGNIISSYIKNNDFKADKGEVKSIFINKNIKNIILAGLGEENKYSLDVLSATIADVSKRLRDVGAERFSIFLDSFKNNFNDEAAVEKLILSSLISLYKFTEFKTKDKDKLKYIRQITILTNSNSSFEKEIKYASVVADAVKKNKRAC